MGSVAKTKGSGHRPAPSPEDRRQDEATLAAALAMGPVFESLGLRRQIYTLTRDELRTLAIAVVSAWVIKRAEQAAEPDGKGIGRELTAG